MIWYFYGMQIIGFFFLSTFWGYVLKPILSGDDNQETGDEEDDENIPGQP